VGVHPIRSNEIPNENSKVNASGLEEKKNAAGIEIPELGYLTRPQLVRSVTQGADFHKAFVAFTVS
jgi:hypothetical protein